MGPTRSPQLHPILVKKRCMGIRGSDVGSIHLWQNAVRAFEKYGSRWTRTAWYYIRKAESVFERSLRGNKFPVFNQAAKLIFPTKQMMRKCWCHTPEERPSFRVLKDLLTSIAQGLANDWLGVKKNELLVALPAAQSRNPRFDALLAELKLILAKRARPVKPRRKSFSTLDEPRLVVDPHQVKLEYYSSLLDRKPEPPKCLSDDYLDYVTSYSKSKLTRRDSVTEPSTPTVRASVLPESELSETESSVPSDGFRHRWNSLESFHEPRIRRPKRAKVVRKASASSTSSYDSRPELVASRKMRKSASCHVKSRKETCRCLMERPAIPPCGTKSLPRNHKPHSAITRHLSDALRCEKDCLQILKAVSKEVEEPRASYSRSTNQPRYPKTAEIKKLKSAAGKGPALALVPPPPRCQTLDRLEKKRDKLVAADECVLRIEDGNLWIEICKAVQETESRARKSKPRD